MGRSCLFVLDNTMLLSSAAFGSGFNSPALSSGAAQAYPGLFYYIDAFTGIGQGQAPPMLRPWQLPPLHFQEPCQALLWML